MVNKKTLIQNFVNRGSRERKIGRYNASEVGGIIKGYKTPKNFFKQETITGQSLSNILSGISYEKTLKEIFDYNELDYFYEPKKELEIDDFVIVCVPDFVFPNKIIETKCPANNRTSPIEKYEHQLEIEHRCFNLPVYLGLFSHPFDVKFIPYKPSDDLFEEIKTKVGEFHKQLKKLYG